MFNDLNAQGSQAVDDIFAETDRSGSPAASNIETQPAGLSAQSYGEPEEDKGGGSKLKLILIIVLSVLILGAAAYLVYSKFMRPSEDLPLEDQQTQVPSGQNTTTTAPIVEDDVVVPQVEGEESTASNTAPIVGSDASTTVEMPVTAAVDSDGDSLLDSQEEVIGTNPNVIDSDFDGLSDYEESTVYGTNPLNPDTDGDTFKDGDEVKNGYNPKGDGKL
ncbi:MAG: hypothetical protein ACM3PZ_01365 [Bacillota bacterium]